ncbi:hypothetical protein AQUCO_00200080v1, partial [Aquilegia coerulea]
MEEMYGFHSSTLIDYEEQQHQQQQQPLMLPANMITPADYQNLLCSGAFRDRIPIFGSDHLFSAASSALCDTTSGIQTLGTSLDYHQGSSEGSGDMITSSIKARIASHPLYPCLLEAYIDCQKVGAPPEIAGLLEEIRRENNVCKRSAVSTRLGTDPELDEFMETYCDILVKYKSDLARPFDEATAFLNNIELQLGNLCKGPSRSCVS